MQNAKLTDMKLSKAEKKANNEGCCISTSGGPDYSWGLEINLDDAALKKLGVKALPEVAGECRIVAVGKITSASMTAGEKNTSRNVRIQITKLDIDFAGDDEKAMQRGFAKGSKK